MPMYRFKLVAGRHVDRSGGVRKTYVKGDIIETEQDLSVHNSYGSLKFLALGEVPEGQASKDTGMTDEDRISKPIQTESEDGDDDAEDIDVENLEQYSVAVLRKFADQMDIDLGSATRKAEIIVAIKAAIE